MKLPRMRSTTRSITPNAEKPQNEISSAAATSEIADTRRVSHHGAFAGKSFISKTEVSA